MAKHGSKTAGANARKPDDTAAGEATRQTLQELRREIGQLRDELRRVAAAGAPGGEQHTAVFDAPVLNVRIVAGGDGAATFQVQGVGREEEGAPAPAEVRRRRQRLPSVDQVAGRARAPPASLLQLFAMLHAMTRASPEFFPRLRDFVDEHVELGGDGDDAQDRPQIVVPPPEGLRAWVRAWTVGFDRPVEGVAGTWRFLTLGDNSAEQLAQVNLGGQDGGIPGSAHPTAQQVADLRAHQAANGLPETTGEIDIVWVPGPDFVRVTVDQRMREEEVAFPIPGPQQAESKSGTRDSRRPRERNKAKARPNAASSDPTSLTEARPASTTSRRPTAFDDVHITGERRVELVDHIDEKTGKQRRYGYEPTNPGQFVDSYEKEIARGKFEAEHPSGDVIRRSSRVKSRAEDQQAQMPPPAQAPQRKTSKTKAPSVAVPAEPSDANDELPQEPLRQAELDEARRPQPEQEEGRKKKAGKARQMSAAASAAIELKRRHAPSNRARIAAQASSSISGPDARQKDRAMSQQVTVTQPTGRAEDELPRRRLQKRKQDSVDPESEAESDELPAKRNKRHFSVLTEPFGLQTGGVEEGRSNASLPGADKSSFGGMRHSQYVQVQNGNEFETEDGEAADEEAYGPDEEASGADEEASGADEEASGADDGPSGDEGQDDDTDGEVTGASGDGDQDGDTDGEVIQVAPARQRRMRSIGPQG